MERSLLAKELYALMVLYGKKVPQEDMEIFVNEWEKAIGWMSDNDFIAACSQVKESGTRFFPRPSDLRAAYSQQCRSVVGDGQISGVDRISMSQSKRWDRHRSLVASGRYAEAADVAMEIMNNGASPSIMDSIIQHDRAKAVGDDRGVMAAVNKAAKDFLPDDLGRWAIKAQSSELEPHDNAVKQQDVHHDHRVAVKRAAQLRLAENGEW